MTNREIEQRLARAIEAATPDVIDRVLDRIEADSGQESRWTPEVYRAPTKRAGAALQRAVGAIAALLVLTVGSYIGYGHLTVDSVIGLDVNPSVELRVNRFDRVRSAEAKNGDGDAILADMNLKNVDLDVAVNAIIGSMLRTGYLSEADNAVLISVGSGSAARGAELQMRLTDEVSEALEASHIAGAVISQTVSEDARIAALAADYGISLGKAALIDMLVGEEGEASFAELAALPIGDIHLLIASQGAEIAGVFTSGRASEAKYIGEEAAMAAALDHLDIDRGLLTSLTVALGYEEGAMVYRIDFAADSATGSAVVNAVTGGIIRYEKVYRVPDAAVAIGVEAAQSIALDHAGLSTGQVRFTSAAFDEISGRFTVIFEADAATYTYQIDAYTGDIVTFDRTVHTAEPVDVPEESAAAPETSTAPATGEVIGEDRAKAIALEHAGVPEDEAIFVKAVQYTKAGVRLYDLAFLLPTTRYTYQIEACTGEVLAVYAYPIHSAYYNAYSGNWGSWGSWAGRDDEDPSPSGHGSDAADSYIGEAAARAAALAHAGVREADVTRFTCKLKSKGNRMVYEIAFRVDKSKYEYRIDAISGNVVAWEAN